MVEPGPIHLLIGPVGAGKSTFARRKILDPPGVFLDADAWMVRLFGADPRPAEGVMDWYLERRERVRTQIREVAEAVRATGTPVWLELGLVRAPEREDAYRRAGDHGPLHVWLLDAPRDVRRERVAARNHDPGPTTQVVPPAFFERASDLWEPPTPDEIATWAIREV